MGSKVKIPTFLSVGAPHNDIQKEYIEVLISYLKKEHISPQTLGRNFWSIRHPLKPVQQKMTEVYGAVILAMERFHSVKGIYREGSDREEHSNDQYFTTIWTQIEAAMAYQLDLPLLILKEMKVKDEGMFDPGIHDWMVIRIDPMVPNDIKRDPLKAIIESWIEEVKRNYYSRND